MTAGKSMKADTMMFRHPLGCIDDGLDSCLELLNALFMFSLNLLCGLCDYFEVTV